MRTIIVAMTAALLAGCTATPPGVPAPDVSTVEAVVGEGVGAAEPQERPTGAADGYEPLQRWQADDGRTLTATWWAGIDLPGAEDREAMFDGAQLRTVTVTDPDDGLLVFSTADSVELFVTAPGGVYAISVAAPGEELHPDTFEAAGLVTYAQELLAWTAAPHHTASPAEEEPDTHVSE